ncbi:hypothetical protein HYQ46_008457 [Verticillium longisporum]|nr:hypothetical protein HYQ46_008457 [Verticillium longisporum]
MNERQTGNANEEKTNDPQFPASSTSKCPTSKASTSGAGINDSALTPDLTIQGQPQTDQKPQTFVSGEQTTDHRADTTQPRRPAFSTLEEAAPPKGRIINWPGHC